jgi:glycosyltransferase involved in cell wall biosynthesis
MAINRRLKVLVSAYACSPSRGSEPGVGWGFVSALARHHDLWVLVEEEKFREDIERALAANPELGKSIHFHFIRKKRNRRLRKIWPPSYYRYYRQWHQEALRLAESLHREVHFDLAHQLTMVGFREPGYLWTLGIPFVWGPVGGMGLFPWRFLPAVGVYGALYYLGYNLYNLLQMRFLSRPRRAARAGGGSLIAATAENRESAMRYWGCPSTVMCEVGLPQKSDEKVHVRALWDPLRIVWAGMHVPGKALNIGLQALSRLPADVDWELHILGSGRQTAQWKDVADRLGVAGRCLFHGWVAHTKALEVMSRGHMMLITSLRDLTSTVTVEALALGLPIVCLDHCGFADVVNETCGIKISVTTPTEVVAAIACAVEALARDEDQRQALAQGALMRAQHFAWEEKARVIDRIYRAKVSQSEATEEMQRRGSLLGI